MALCLICLRTEKILRLASNTLEQFYNDLCDSPIVNMTYACYYCNECEYILTKFYKFKQKCVKALKIYLKWKSEKASKKQSVDYLYRLLPPSGLGVWANIEQIAVFTLQVMDKNTILCKKLDTTCNNEGRQECDKTDNIYTIHALANNINSESISETFTKLSQMDELQTCGVIEEQLYKLKDVSESCSQTMNDNEHESNANHKQGIKGSNKNAILKKCRKIVTKSKEKIQENSAKSYNLDDFLSDDAETINDDDDTNLKNIHDTEGNHKKIKSKKCASEKLAKKNNDIDDSQAVNDIDLNIIHDTRMLLDKKMTAKKRKGKSVSKTCTGKKITAKMRAYYDKAKRNDKMYESVFDIEYLTTQEMMLAEFQRRQTYECYIKAEHKCEVCYQTFKSLKFLEYHSNKWHTERPGSVFCPICKIWSSKSSTHRLTHTMVFRCKLCTLVTYHRLSMQNHFEWHRGKQYRCEECNYTCKSKSAYQTHMGRVHRRGRHVCGRCGRGFRSPLGLRVHASNTSRCTAPLSIGVGVRCDDCDVTLPSPQVYEAHILDVHIVKTPTARPSETTSAGLPSPRVYERRAPKVCKKRRSTPFMLTCPLCECGGLAGWCQLQQHYRRRHPGADPADLDLGRAKYLCDVCGAGFTQIYGLRDHMNKHTGARPYPCDLCPKRFRSAYLRKEHRLRHFPSTVACPHCGKQFKSKGNLYCHVKTHTGEKNHKCDICGKGFIQKTNLREHIRGVHYNIRRKRGDGRKVSEGGNVLGGGGFGGNSE